MREAAPRSLHRRMVLVAALAGIVALGTACPPEPVETDLLSHLPQGEAQRDALCSRGRDNAVTAVFCGAEAPAISSLVELLRALGLSFGPNENRPGFAMTANSSSLVARHVSALNPRAILVEFPEDRADESFLSLGFARGDQLVELGVRTPTGETTFYLVRYTQRCNDSDGGCLNEDLLTPATEAGWQSVDLYEDEDLKNSVLDCLHCHQPEGPGTAKHFRMPEFENPWTHWIASFSAGGRPLLQDFLAAHGNDEPYAGVPGNLLTSSNPIMVEALFKRTNSVEPNPFPSPVIEREVREGNPQQPSDNTVPGRSPTWTAMYERAVNGEVIPPPYHDVKVTDPLKLQQMTAAYRSFREGTLPRGELPDLREVLHDDALAGMAIRPKPGLDGRGIVVHMCAQCHNSRLDQTVSRAQFDAFRLDDLTDAQKDVVRDRLRRPAEDRYRMPPHFFRDLSEEEIQAVEAVLND